MHTRMMWCLFHVDSHPTPAAEILKYHMAELVKGLSAGSSLQNIFWRVLTVLSGCLVQTNGIELSNQKQVLY